MIARFFRSDAMVERLGEREDVVLEHEGFQLTYNELRSLPNGDSLAYYESGVQEWVVIGQLRSAADDNASFSDVVIAHA